MNGAEEATRLKDVESGLPKDLDLTKICYWYSSKEGRWYLYLPQGGIGCLVNHKVTEHADGTITVSPSIGLKKTPDAGFVRHGYLERGRWREV